MGGAEYNLRAPMDSSVTAKATDAELANSIRALAMDAVEAAKSGHPGMPMGMAEIAVALWKRHLLHNPANPAWPDRDRFVLSNGHGSMLLYSLLHLTGYALPMDELRRFRQLHSKTPGHPERGLAPGVETTTGPLGQGIANAVGMALAERLLAAEFNRPGHAIVDHHTYVFMGDGCMMEGLSHEACSLAGTLGLGKLIAVYDDNSISIDSDKGRIKQWFTDDVRRRFEAYGWQDPAEAAEFKRRVAGQLPGDFDERVSSLLKEASEKAETMATRKASQQVLEVLVPALPELLGGSADLTGSNLTMVKASRVVGREGGGNYVFYGVREFGMCATMNGVSLHGGLIPYGGTFLVFSDYARNALRLAALMGIRVTYVFTHDSIGLGEDGPTHQPIEHAASLRLMPNMEVWRPCDGAETAVAWAAALRRKDGPTALLLTRQNVPFVKRNSASDIERGGYVVSDPGQPRAVVIATGSEVHLAVGAQALLVAEGIALRVVSMPSTSVFDRQSEEYRKSVLPPGLPRVAVEAGVTDYWRKYVGLEGAVVGIDRFGESAPAGDLFKFLGFTPENVAKAVRSILK